MSRFDASLYARAAQALRPAPKVELSSALEIAAALCRRFEGFYSKPYLCPAGVPTIGYGATHYLDGRPVRLSDPPISREAGERLLLRMLETTYIPALLKLCPGIAQATPGQFAAMIDFTFNVGGSRLAASTLRKRVNAGAWGEVPAELRKWTRGGGRVLRGLVVRREAEAALV